MAVGITFANPYLSEPLTRILYVENNRSPITIMRNELISQGGSGVPIDRDAYMKSVEYWKDHAVVM